MKKTLSIIAFALAAAPAAAQTDTVRMSLEDCIGYALGRSYGRQSVKLNEKAREIDLEQSKLERLPGLSGDASQSYRHSENTGSAWNGSYDLSASMTLWQGGQINQTVRQNELTREQTGLRSAQYDNELTIKILEAFLAALGNEELLKFQRGVLVSSAEQARQGKVRFETGDILESDYLLFEAQYASDRNSITETTISLENSLYALKNLMSMDLSQPIALVYPDTAAMASMSMIPPADYVVERSLETLPDIRISDYDVEIAQTGLRISRSGLYPTLALRGGIGTGTGTNLQQYGAQMGDNFNQSAGLSLSIPIFSKGRTRSAIAQSKVALQQAELERMQTRMTVEQTLRGEYGGVASALSKYHAAGVKENAYHKSFEAYSAMFEAGAITPVDLLQRQNNYIGAINDYVQSKYGFMLKRKILDVYMGIPVTM